MGRLAQRVVLGQERGDVRRPAAAFYGAQQRRGRNPKGVGDVMRTRLSERTGPAPVTRACARNTLTPWAASPRCCDARPAAPSTSGPADWRSGWPPPSAALALTVSCSAGVRPVPAVPSGTPDAGGSGPGRPGHRRDQPAPRQLQPADHCRPADEQHRRAADGAQRRSGQPALFRHHRVAADARRDRAAAGPDQDPAGATARSRSAESRRRRRTRVRRWNSALPESAALPPAATRPPRPCPRRRCPPPIPTECWTGTTRKCAWPRRPPRSPECGWNRNSRCPPTRRAPC